MDRPLTSELLRHSGFFLLYSKASDSQ